MPHDPFLQIRGLGHTATDDDVTQSINTMSGGGTGGGGPSRPPAWHIVMGLWDSRLIKDSFKFIFLYSR